MKLAIIDQASGTLIIDEVKEELIEQCYDCSIPAYVEDKYMSLGMYTWGLFDNVKHHTNGEIPGGTFKVRCNGETALFPETKRLDQINYYSSLLENASDINVEQYNNILEGLITGQKFCSDSPS